MNARFEVWFLSDERISVLVETDQEEAPAAVRELLTIRTVAATAAGMIANLRRDLRIVMCDELEACSLPASLEEVPSGMGDFVFVPHGVERGPKGFEGTFKMKGETPVARYKPRGFGMFSREVQDYSPTAMMALLLHVLGGLSEPGRAILVQTAHTLGRLGLAGGIGMTNHPGVAIAAVDEALDALDLTEATGDIAYWLDFDIDATSARIAEFWSGVYEEAGGGPGGGPSYYPDWLVRRQVAVLVIDEAARVRPDLDDEMSEAFKSVGLGADNRMAEDDSLDKRLDAFLAEYHLQQIVDAFVEDLGGPALARLWIEGVDPLTTLNDPEQEARFRESEDFMDVLRAAEKEGVPILLFPQYRDAIARYGLEGWRESDDDPTVEEMIAVAHDRGWQLTEAQAAYTLWDGQDRWDTYEQAVSDYGEAVIDAVAAARLALYSSDVGFSERTDPAFKDVIERGEYQIEPDE